PSVKCGWGNWNMHRTVLVALALVTTMWLTSPAPAYFYDGQKISQLCNSGGDAICLGFVAGVVDSVPRPFCLPHGLQLGTLQKVFQKFLTDYPERLTEDASSLVVAAMVKAYPCSRAR